MKNLLKTLFLLIFLFLNLGLAAQKNNDKLSENSHILNSEKPKFSITFPSKYKLSESKVEKGLKSEMYQSAKDGNIFMLTYSEYKNSAVSSENKLFTEASLNSFMKETDSELIKKYEFKQKKQKGLEAVLKMKEKNIYIFYRVFIYKHTQFQLTVISNSQEKTKDINNFFNSFSL